MKRMPQKILFDGRPIGKGAQQFYDILLSKRLARAAKRGTPLTRDLIGELSPDCYE